MAQNPRDIAVWALEDRQGFVSRRLDALLERNPMSPPDRALARELALGVCRRRSTLEAVLRAFMQMPNRPLPGSLPEILLVGAYQLLFLDRIPPHAAVNESVEQAIRHKHNRKSGLVNGVLRTIARSVSAPIEGPPPAAADVIPMSSAAYRKADRALFPDPEQSPVAYLAAAYSIPNDLASRWIARFGLPAAAGMGAR